MRNTGIVRKVDELGRIVLPKELRNILSIDRKDPLEIYTEDDGSIILKKYQKTCVFCGKYSDLYEFKDRYICKNCKDELNI